LTDARIICASSTKIKVWNIKEKRFDLEIDYSRLLIGQVIAVDKLIAVISRHEREIILYDSFTGKQISTLLCDLGCYWPSCMAALPNGNIVCTYGPLIKIFDPYSGICCQSFCANDNRCIYRFKVINDGRIISCSNKENENDDYLLRIWS